MNHSGSTRGPPVWAGVGGEAENLCEAKMGEGIPGGRGGACRGSPVTEGSEVNWQTHLGLHGSAFSVIICFASPQNF